MAKRLSLGRLERLVEELDRDIDLEGSDVTVNSLVSDSTVAAGSSVTAVTLVAAGASGARSRLNGGTLETSSTANTTQTVSKAASVILDKIHGTITMHAAALADDTTVSFQVTTSHVAIGDVVVVTQNSNGGTLDAYQFDTSAAAGTFRVSVRNVSGGALSEAVQLNFFILKVSLLA
tara:strand:- start:51 stop:581 length:531 start_codon:yes stop_codon:yes gene_type:complete